MQKSAQRYEKRGDNSETRCNVGSFEGWQLGEGVPPHYMHEFENKRVEFLVGAKKCKRVRKSMKTKDGTVVGSEEWLLGFVRCELVPVNWERGYNPRGDEKSA